LGERNRVTAPLCARSRRARKRKKLRSAFLDFIAGHLGAEPTLAVLGALAPADFRAYLAATGNHLRASSRARVVSAARSLPCHFRFTGRIIFVTNDDLRAEAKKDRARTRRLASRL
jgi:hypothetical protein